MPWILCGPGWPPLRMGDSAGSTPTIRTSGLRSFSTWPTPVMVPPVPMPETKMSTPPSVSSQTSSAVVSAVDLDVGLVLELLREHRAGGLGGDLRGAGDGALHALAAGGEHEFGPVGAQQRPALLAHGLGHGDDDAVAPCGADHRERDAGVAARALDDGAAGLQRARRLRRIDDADAESVLHAGRGVVELELREHGRGGAVGHAVQSHERRATEDLGDVVEDLGHGASSRVCKRRWMPRPSLRRRPLPVTCVTFHFVDERMPAPRARDLRTVRDETAARLASAGVPDPEVDAELLIGHVLGLSRGGVQARAVVGGTLDDAQAAELEALVVRRASREPLQHVTGRAAFRSLELAVGPGVFVPRPETEQVAQLAIDALRAAAEPEPIAVDLGAGSGAIALALATEVPHARVWAVENSTAAFPWTQRNVEEVGATNLELVFGDLATALPELDGRVAVVISNPPYVPAGEIPVDPEVHLHDPVAALYGGPDGLDVVRVLSRRAAALLHAGGLLVIEHAETQSAPIAAILVADGWRAIAHHRDLTSRDRATTALR